MIRTIFRVHDSKKRGTRTHTTPLLIIIIKINFLIIMDGPKKFIIISFYFILFFL